MRFYINRLKLARNVYVVDGIDLDPWNVGQNPLRAKPPRTKWWADKTPSGQNPSDKTSSDKTPGQNPLTFLHG